MSQPVDTVKVGIELDWTGVTSGLQSGITARLREVASSASATMSAIERGSDEAGDDIARDFREASASAQGSLRALSAESTTAFNNVGRQAGQAANDVQNRLGGALAFLRTSLLALGIAVGTGLVAIAGFGLKATAQLEQTQIAFNSLLGGAEAGQKAFKELQQFAAATPFEFPEVAGAAQRFFAFSGSVGLAKDQVGDFLTTIGNVASVTGGGAQALNSITLAMGQIASSGKVTLDNLNQISEALPGFSGVAAIANATGKTTAEVMTEISSGSLDATTGIQALLQGMKTFPGAAGAMEAQSKTLLGVFSTFKDTLSQALVAGFAPVIPQLKAQLTEVTPLLGEAIGQLAPIIGQLIGALLPLVGNLIKAIVPILTPLLEALGPALTALGPALIPLGEALAQIIVPLTPLIPLVAQFAVVLIQLLVPVLKLLALVLTPLQPLLTFLAKAVAQFGAFLSSIDWKGIAAAIGGAFLGALEAVGGFFVMIGQWFADLPGKIWDALLALPGLLQTAIANAFTAMFFAIGFGIGLLVKGFLTLPGLLVDIVVGLWKTVSQLFVEGVTAVVTFLLGLPGTLTDIFVSAVKGIIGAIVAFGPGVLQWFLDLPGNVVDALGGLVDKLYNVGRDVIIGLWNGMKNVWGNLVNWAKEKAADLWHGFTKALGIGSPSKVFADEVGRWIPAGIKMGIESGMPDLQATMNGIAASLPAGAGGGGPANGGGIGLAAGAVIVNVNGSISPTEARQVGAAVATGVIDNTRRIQTAIRSA